MKARTATRYLILLFLIVLLGFHLQAKAEGEPPRPADAATSAGPAQEQPSSPSSVTPDSGQPSPPDAVGQLAPLQPPQDPCLPALFRDWREWSLQEKESAARFVRARITIDLERFRLVLEGVRSDGSTEEVYSTHVALGDADRPTPGGQFIINHVYCYPDVVFFDVTRNRVVPEFYKGFFAPLLACDDQGRCERFHDLGIHGFDASAYPEPGKLRPETYGPVSGGCIRLPDPCLFKTELIRLVGIGPMKQNDRGCYHWLNKPVEVRIPEEEFTLLSILQEGFLHIQRGMKNLIGIFGP